MDPEFIEEFAEVFDLESEEMTEGYKFEGPECWDSLAIVSTIALVDQYFDIALKADEFTKCQTFGELVKLVNDKKG